MGRGKGMALGKGEGVVVERGKGEKQEDIALRLENNEELRKAW